MNFKKLTAIGLLVLAWAGAGTAHATTPANTLLQNTAKLVYDGNATGITTSVTVTVELVPAAVSIAATFSAPNASVNKAENQSYSATYVVQSNANGPDTYTVAGVYESTNNVSGAASPTTSTASLSLGATAAAASAASGQATITVPSDGASDGAINGLAAGETVVIAGATYTIDSITDNASGTSSIVLTTNLASSLSLGDGIFEYRSFTVDITDVGANGGAVNRLDLRTTVTSDTTPNPVFTFDVDINLVAILVDKFVRNTAGVCATCGGAGTVSYDADGAGAGTSETYYDAGVTAAPGATLEYVLVIQTSTAPITTALITDVLPDFTTYEASSTFLNGIAVTDEASGNPFPLDSGSDDGGLLVDDNGSRTAGTEGTGAIGTGQTVYVTYRVTVDS